MKKSFRKISQRSEFKSQGGFTLIELVIAITILSLITVIIGSAFRLGIQAWERGEKETEDSQRLRVLSTLLSQQLHSIYPYMMNMEDKDEDVVIFKGESDSVTFVTTLVDSSYGGFKWVKYVFRDGTLLYKEGMLPDKEFEEHVNDKEDHEIIDTNIDDCQFSYLSAEEEEWKETWDLGEDFPAAVKVTISDFQPIVIRIPFTSYGDSDLEPEGTGDDEDI